MNRIAIAITVAVLAIAAILAGTYAAFFALAAQIPAGRTLGMISAALMVGSGLACAGVGYVANKWAQRRLRGDR
jgi:hypothetical protein